MAWAASTSFETTDGSTTPTDGNNIAGTGDGSGWSGNWTEFSASTGYHDYDNGVASIPDGSWCCICNTGTSDLEPGIYRNVASAVTSGRVSFRFRCNKVNRDSHMVTLQNGTTRRMYLVFENVAEPNLRNLIDSGGTIASGVFAKDTWYKIDIDFDCTTDTYDVYVDDVKKNGAARNFESAATDIDRLIFRNNAASSSGSTAGSIHFWDKIEPYGAAAPASVTPPPQIITWGLLATVLHAGTFLIDLLTRPFATQYIHNG